MRRQGKQRVGPREIEGRGVEVRKDGHTTEEVLDALGDAAVDDPPPLDALLQDAKNLQREKWDWALPDRR